MQALLEPAGLFAVAVVFIAAVVVGIGGFGFALVFVPLLLLVYEPATAIPVNAALAVFTTAAVAFEARREAEIKSISLLLPFALAGLIAGVEVLRAANPDHIRFVVGVAVVASALLLFYGVRLPGSGSRWSDGVAGSVSGLLATSTGLSGPPVILLMTSRGLSRRAFRANISLYFLLLNSASLVVLYLRGLFEPSHLLLAVALSPIAFIGKATGAALLHRFSEKVFRNLTLALILMTGVGSAISAILSML